MAESDATKPVSAEEVAQSVEWLQWQADLLEAGDDKFAGRARTAAALLQRLARERDELYLKANAWEQFVSLQTGDVKKLCDAALRAESAERALRALLATAEETQRRMVRWGKSTNELDAAIDAARKEGK